MKGGSENRKKHGRKEGRGSELGMASKEIQWAENGSDDEAFARAEWYSVRSRRRKRQRGDAER